ncbi:MAG: tRNA preQ1(34) S-adenosylmethionine ribosyltransferase-isomerase QueA [Kiritimatiellae bacterium]|jgi:S-adenosylmethionine:tRNA ribosyltransferase-isomerase|nr:tRNA preQ1(34) S-adenosylmethionine ribosyltransferase-isomerase QueA [Kiritimatiellia bacterium]
MKTSDFNFDLPEELIAQEPPAERGASRMLVLHRDSGKIEHRMVSDIIEYLNPADLMVLNNTKVFPARLKGGWADTGGALELLLLQPLPMTESMQDSAPEQVCWRCLSGSGRKVRPGLEALFAQGNLKAQIIERHDEGICKVIFCSQQPLMEILDNHGLTPVPPYIHRDGDERQTRLDRERYQTIYAQETGAVAAPTAGLHFTDKLFAALDKKGVKREYVTLHVGPGTFKPVKADIVEEHRMDAERYSVSSECAQKIKACHKHSGRVVCVGSTTVRTLESVAANNSGTVVEESGESSIFIYPPYEFKAADVMLTNFHLPQSTLIMMVAALAGRELIMEAYTEAIKKRYRFFSYGDCMLIL